MSHLLNGRKLGAWIACVAVLAAFPVAWAGGPRFVTGTNFTGAPSGTVMSFFTPNPLYYTDPGNLNANVTHAQADAMVAAAAAIWNVPTSLLTLAQGGELTEHVSDANSYFNGTSVVFPADVLASNYIAKPIAVIYDTDGSITELLLGSGASDPSSCRLNGVTESVDGFGQTGTIEHAVIVLNGRCVGSAPEQLLQMQYQLERAFGRVVGLAWAQVNDNAFTGLTTVTANQLANWPVMHPIDVICGTYTYQCMQSPFQLRPDDICTLAWLYPVTAANATAGKTPSLSTNSLAIQSTLFFPTLQGMDAVNVTVTWGLQGAYIDDFQIVSGVAGYGFQRNIGNPVTGRSEPAADNQGNGLEGYFQFASIPLSYSQGRVNVLEIDTEPINPLYSGEYAIGIYEGTPTVMSGAPQTMGGWLPTADFLWQFTMTSPTATSTCNPGNDGVETAPVAADPSGLWANVLCGTNHVSWRTVSVKAGRTWTLETTATDETGGASEQKARPVIGVWKSTDPVGGLPTVASTPSAMNATSLGLTQLPMAATTQNQTVRIAIADLYGGGRPDYTYNARILYADGISPGVVGAGGGQITITGMGFRPGNQVMVNGVLATVVSCTSTQIVADVPTMVAAGMSVGTAANVAVIDPGTGGQTVMSAVLSYSSAPNVIKLVSAPATVETGLLSATLFAAEVYASDGLAPVPGVSVTLTVSGGASLKACNGASSCLVSTASTGLAQSAVTGVAVGKVVLTAREMDTGASVSVTVEDVNPVLAATAPVASHYLAAGMPASWYASVVVTVDGAPATTVYETWSTTGGSLVVTPGSINVTNATGTASTPVQTTTGLAAGAQGTVTGCAWTVYCASQTVYAVAASQWKIAVSSGAGQSVKSTATLSPVVLLVTDGSGHPVQGATVKVLQTVDAWEGACPALGPCPAAPVLATGTTTGTSDANGLLTVTPLQVPGVPQVVNLAATAGTQGFATLTLDATP